MPESPISSALSIVPAGAWAIGVSGGADSVALLKLAADRRDLSLVVVHVDHQLRGTESDGDAAFVAALCERLRLRCEIVRRSDIEARHPIATPNPSARYRAARQAAFADAVSQHQLRGVLLAHHRDDQAETILQRLLRGGPITSLAGMSAMARLGGLTIARPLLSVSQSALRKYLGEIGQLFREDASNVSPKQQRNRVRAWLADRPGVSEALLELGIACADWRDWVNLNTPKLPADASTRAIADWPLPIARAAVLQWLRDAGVPAAEASVAAADRVIGLATDAAMPGDVALPGPVRIRRRAGRIRATRG